MASDSPQNRLAGNASPYLRQHADNPVHWQPWDEQALTLARRENKLILLSIGYAACHWCHVMAHESFEDEATAGVMNQHFVNIKVDREERPDLDKIYQIAHQLLTQRPGGWPLTVFLTPDEHIPVFAGTYFPATARQGMPGFSELLQRIARFWAEQPEDLKRQNDAVKEAFAKISAPPPAADEVSPAPLQQARQELAEVFDSNFGGFGNAPKFPHPTSIDRLLRHYAHSVQQQQPDRDALHMACHTLRRMALGGICDQVGGGFARYSVDELWMIPHFEKMLYDNGQLLSLYADAWHATGDELFARTAEEIGVWIMREMQSEQGGYYASLDADSEGVEGRFYVWDRDKLQDLLPADDYRLMELRFGLDEPANFEGQWHLHVHASLSELAKALQKPREQVKGDWYRIRATLYQLRRQRVAPGLDNKILTSWNALAIKGMARAGRILEKPALIDSAIRALDYLRTHAWDGQRLLAASHPGHGPTPGFLDDYAFLLDALLEMLQTRWRNDDLTWAKQLATRMLALFKDPDNGGLLFTPADHEPLLDRPRPLMDEATPAGAGVAIAALHRLGLLVGDGELLAEANHALMRSIGALSHVPHAHGALLNALEDHLHPVHKAVLCGEADTAHGWLRQVNRYYAPNRMLFYVPVEAAAEAGITEDLNVAEGEVLAMVCRGQTCFEPVNSAMELESLLRRD